MNLHSKSSSPVLVVDDDIDMLFLMDIVCKDVGLSIVTAQSLPEVQRKKYLAMKCCMAILDINLGAHQPSGIEICRWLKKELFSGTILFLTGHASTYDEAIRAEFPDIQIVEKPLQIEGLIKVVESNR